jgi:nucleoside-diphosphate-sugar epimerase
MADPEQYVDERSPLNPVSLYAELKVGFERYLMACDTPTFTPTCLRFATAYGLSPRPRFDLTVNEFTYVLASGRKLEIYGGQFWRPYCHTTDLARACLTVLQAEADSVRRKAFNVGSTTENYRKLALAELIAKELGGLEERIVNVERVEDPRDYRVNFDRIRHELGFVPARRVIDGVREIAWALRSKLIGDPENHLYRNN